MRKTKKKVAKNAKLLAQAHKHIAKITSEIESLEQKSKKEDTPKEAVKPKKVKKTVAKAEKKKPIEKTATPKVEKLTMVSTGMLVVEAVAEIEKLQSADEVKSFVASEKRVTVRRVAEEKIKGL